MDFEFSYTNRFKKSFKSFSQDDKKQISKKLQILVKNPNHPSLRTKRIQGSDDLFECSINMDIRVIWYYEGVKLIVLLDVGHHDILKRF